MKVMSLFDGMSCGQIALKKLGAKAFIGARGELQLQRDLQNSMQIIE